MIEIHNRQKIKNSELVEWATEYKNNNSLKDINERDTESGDIKETVYESKNGLQVAIKNNVNITIILEKNSLKIIPGIVEEDLKNKSSALKNTNLSRSTCQQYRCANIKTLEKFLNAYFEVDTSIQDKDYERVSGDVNDIRTAKDLTETQRATLVEARIGQGKFKKNVIEAFYGEKSCSLTGINLQELLIASHIKPWSESSNKERLDGANGIILSANIDKLFDRYLITFNKKNDNYQIDISKIINQETCEKLGLFENMVLQKKIKDEFVERFENYLKMHNEIFKEKEIERF